MQAMIGDALAIVIACLVIAALIAALLLFRPWRRRHRHRKRRSRRPKIDLFQGQAAESAGERDA